MPYALSFAFLIYRDNQRLTVYQRVKVSSTQVKQDTFDVPSGSKPGMIVTARNQAGTSLLLMTEEENNYRELTTEEKKQYGSTLQTGN